MQQKIASRTEWLNDEAIHPDVKALIEHYQFERLPVEGTLYKTTYRATHRLADGGPAGTAMIGMYAHNPLSVSCFHKLRSDEVWHVYGGDPFCLILLHGDGTSQEVLMGKRPERGESVQFTVPADTWQAGYLVEGGRYALFGCTMAPGYRGKDFLAGTGEDLIARYPDCEEIILKLSVNGHETRMPQGFEDD